MARSALHSKGHEPHASFYREKYNLLMREIQFVSAKNTDAKAPYNVPHSALFGVTSAQGSVSRSIEGAVVRSRKGFMPYQRQRVPMGVSAALTMASE